jgi:hypothetical protein
MRISVAEGTAGCRGGNGDSAIALKTMCDRKVHREDSKERREHLAGVTGLL